MSTGADAPRAVLEIVAAGRPIDVAIERTVACDLDLVDRLLWLCLLARRQGWSVRLDMVDDELADLLDLVGVADDLVPPSLMSPLWSPHDHNRDSSEV